jgi:hypothetical protein
MHSSEMTRRHASLDNNPNEPSGELENNAQIYALPLPPCTHAISLRENENPRGVAELIYINTVFSRSQCGQRITTHKHAPIWPCQQSIAKGSNPIKTGAKRYLTII